ncbi:unnamed protein product [Phytophthora fragariaefolia]|uniref:Unnamed protein product n=1 Tax=Phytophthora fragariaefolia TaxID=1490495 RepID=A0A9W6Y0K3_9STRA|nr:unnamed protein product [Phytophthora fragariaefolia]
MHTLAKIKISVNIGGINRTRRTSVSVEDAALRSDPEGSIGDLYVRAEECGQPCPVPNFDLSQLTQISTIINLIFSPN